MRVSTRGDYASRALLSLALHGAETPTSVRDIAERTGLPQPYLEQILLALKGAGLVRSKRGVGGGYVLARPPEEITLAQIVSAVDGPIAAGDFGEPHANGACDHEGQCVLLAVWADVGETIRTHLQSYSLADMVDRARGNVAARRLTGAVRAASRRSRPWSRSTALDGRPVVAPRPEHADCPGPQDEEPAGHGRQPEPAGGQHPEEVAVGDAERVALEGSRPLDHPVGPPAHVRQPLAPGHPVVPQVPAGSSSRISAVVRPS